MSQKHGMFTEFARCNTVGAEQLEFPLEIDVFRVAKSKPPFSKHDVRNVVVPAGIAETHIGHAGHRHAISEHRPTCNHSFPNFL